MTTTNYRLTHSDGRLRPGSTLVSVLSNRESGTARRPGWVIRDHELRDHELDEFLAESFADPAVAFVAVWDQDSGGEDFLAHYKRAAPTELPVITSTTVRVRSATAGWVSERAVEEDLASGIAAVLDTLRRQYPGLRFESEVTR
jgi:hypothetical protein